MKSTLTALTARLASAYLGHNQLSSDKIPHLLNVIYDALRDAERRPWTEAAQSSVSPATNPKKSITPHYLVCLEDGKRFKSLKRHLWAHHGLTPEAYRAKWGLAGDYPTVAPAYASRRAELARANGLGRKRRPRRKGTASP